MAVALGFVTGSCTLPRLDERHGPGTNSSARRRTRIYASESPWSDQDNGFRVRPQRDSLSELIDDEETNVKAPRQQTALSRRALISSAVMAPVLSSLFLQVGKAFAETSTDRSKRQFAMMMESTMVTYEASVAPLKRKLFQANIPAGSRILDLGVGTGPNIKYYPSGTSIVGVDPNSYMEEYAVDKASGTGAGGLIRDFKFVVGEGESLSSLFDADEFDVVVTTLTLCSVANPEVVLDEISRVLKPGGKLLFIEHVGANPGSPLRFAQKLLDPLQQSLSDGCHLTRDTETLIRSSGKLAVESLERFRLSGLEAILIRPHIFGVAAKV